MNPWLGTPEYPLKQRFDLESNGDPSGEYPVEHVPSMCDSCAAPGACCRGFLLNVGFPVDADAAEVTRQVQEKRTPFVAWKPHKSAHKLSGIYSHEIGPRSDMLTFWRFTCPCLDTRTGRCAAYLARPKLCRSFEAGSDALCVHFKPSTPEQHEAAESRHWLNVELSIDL